LPHKQKTMARGPKKHLKRLNAPSSWMLHKMGGTWAPRPSTGPHKLRESFPLALILRNRLKYALTRREVLMCVMRRTVEVDGKVRTDMNYPTGFQDVVSIPKSDENFRILYDTKGRFILHRIHADEAKYKLCRVTKISKAKKASIGRNPFLHGQAAVIPYCVTHDGRTIRFADPNIRVGDTIRLNLTTGKIDGQLKLDVGNTALITRGHNIGRVGIIVRKERHEGSFDILHLKDKKGNAFATRSGNVFVIGDANNAWITLPRGKGLKLTIMEEREKLTKKKE
jgi:small subunit ribosomal protein S4e